MTETNGDCKPGYPITRRSTVTSWVFSLARRGLLDECGPRSRLIERRRGFDGLDFQIKPIVEASRFLGYMLLAGCCSTSGGSSNLGADAHIQDYCVGFCNRDDGADY